MQVLIWMPNGSNVPGGHRRQLDETAQHLRLLGAEVDVSFESAPEIKRYDIVHGFGLDPMHLRACRLVGVPVALSSIYWEQWYMNGQYRDGQPIKAVKTRVHAGAMLMLNALRGRHFTKCAVLVERFSNQRVVFEMADVLLPNSHLEGEAIKRDLGVTTPIHFAPNAVDASRFTNPAASDAKRDLVLSVARFEPHKNQLGFVQAMSKTDLPVIVTGHTHPDHAGYRERCRRAAGKNVQVIDGVSDDELAALYRRAKVHVLPSWYETTGLVSLEAALAGCNVVTTDRGFAKEYFADMAWYCDPADPDSMRQAVRKAYRAPYNETLRERILANYTWKHTATATLEAYHMALAQKKNGHQAV